MVRVKIKNDSDIKHFIFSLNIKSYSVIVALQKMYIKLILKRSIYGVLESIIF